MKKSNRPLTFAALIAAGTMCLTGCNPPVQQTEDPEVDVYGPPPLVTEESKPEYTDPPLVLDGEVAIDDDYYDENGAFVDREQYDENGKRIDETTVPESKNHTENEVCVYGPPEDFKKNE